MIIPTSFKAVHEVSCFAGLYLIFFLHPVVINETFLFFFFFLSI